MWHFIILQLSYIQESEAEPGELLDEKAGEWDMDVAAQLFALADQCTVAKKKRPTMVQTLQNYLQIVRPWQLCSFRNLFIKTCKNQEYFDRVMDFLRLHMSSPFSQL